MHHAYLSWGASGSKSSISRLDDGGDQCPQLLFLYCLSTYPGNWPAVIQQASSSAYCLPITRNSQMKKINPSLWECPLGVETDKV